MILRTMVGGTRFVDVFETPTTTSTNAHVAAAAKAGAPEGVVLVADEQTAGRGRRDRGWESPPGASLSMSLLLRPTRGGQDWGWLSLIAGMAVTEALRSLAPDPEAVTLKWPNDVLIGGRKVCGILSQRDETPEGPAAVVGIGINLTLTTEQLPVPNATSMALEGVRHDRDEVAAAVINAFDRIYGDWLADGPHSAAYREVCSSIGADLTITVEDAVVRGRGTGIDRDGRLLVDVGGVVRAFAVGDVVHAKLTR